MAFEAYLAGEVAADLADGLIPRREALRRLALLGVGVPAAVALLAGCGGDDEDASAPSTTAAAGVAATTPATAQTAPAGVETIRFAGAAGELTASFAAAATPRAGLLVVHENRGLTPHFPTVVARFAAAGYSALCVDLLSAQGGTAALSDPAGAPAALAAAPVERLVGDLGSGLDELARRTPGNKLGAIGFCFGGGMVWSLLHAGEQRLAAAAPFYGPTPANPDFRRAKAAVLAVYAERDTRVNATRDAATAALAAAGLTHEVKTYAGADHAFFNDTGARYDKAAADQAYADVSAWFARHLA